jgi:hypothetical protein
LVRAAEAPSATADAIATAQSHGYEHCACFTRRLFLSGGSSSALSVEHDRSCHANGTRNFS